MIRQLTTTDENVRRGARRSPRRSSPVLVGALGRAQVPPLQVAARNRWSPGAETL